MEKSPNKISLSAWVLRSNEGCFFCTVHDHHL